MKHREHREHRGCTGTFIDVAVRQMDQRFGRIRQGTSGYGRISGICPGGHRRPPQTLAGPGISGLRFRHCRGYRGGVPTSGSSPCRSTRKKKNKNGHRGTETQRAAQRVIGDPGAQAGTETLLDPGIWVRWATDQRSFRGTGKTSPQS